MKVSLKTLNKNNKSWGIHLMVNCKSCDIKRIDDKENILSFVKNLVKNIKMKAVGDPIISYAAVGDKEKEGYSVLQLIETSSITGHFVHSNGNAYIDVFSCKEYDKKQVLKEIYKYFRPKAMQLFLIYRDI